MDITKFEELLQRPESTILDFKRCQYEIIEDSDERKTAEYVKDIISFCNTTRKEVAYIIIGVGENKDGTKELIGLDKNIDDAIFQDKVKNKVLPIPIFLTYTFEYQDKIFGMIEFPIKKYSEPITPIAKLKGMEVGKVYFRRNTSNSEATGKEVIYIYKWLESLPEEVLGNSLTDEISQVIINASSQNYKLSECIAQALKIAIKYKLEDLKTFCNNELTGWYDKAPKTINDNPLSYRMAKVIATPHKLEVPPYYPFDSRRLLSEMKNDNEHFIQTKFLFTQPISDIEMWIERYNGNNGIITLEVKATGVYVDKAGKSLPLTAYFNNDTTGTLYESIRQKLIDKLMEIC